MISHAVSHPLGSPQKESEKYFEKYVILTCNPTGVETHNWMCPLEASGSERTSQDLVRDRDVIVAGANPASWQQDKRTQSWLLKSSSSQFQRPQKRSLSLVALSIVSFVMVNLKVFKFVEFGVSLRQQSINFCIHSSSTHGNRR